MGHPFISTNQTGDIATAFPLATKVFQKYHIGFCCECNRPIGEVLREKKLPEREILGTLNKLYHDTHVLRDHNVNWNQESFSHLIDHLIKIHHTYLNDALPELSTFTTKVLRVHGNNHPELLSVHNLFDKLKTGIEQHIVEEDGVLFPKIKSYEEAPTDDKWFDLFRTIRDSEDEHAKTKHLLEETRHITNNYSIPEGVCKTYALTYLKLEKLETYLYQVSFTITPGIIHSI